LIIQAICFAKTAIPSVLHCLKSYCLEITTANYVVVFELPKS